MTSKEQCLMLDLAAGIRRLQRVSCIEDGVEPELYLKVQKFCDDVALQVEHRNDKESIEIRVEGQPDNPVTFKPHESTDHSYRASVPVIS